MAYQSSYGSQSRYAQNSFDTRFPDYSPERAGVSRSLFALTLTASVIFALWSGAATIYLLFADDILHRVAVARSDVGRKQDAQIAALQTEIERLRSTKFVDQERMDRQLSELMRLQRLIEQRQKALAALAQSVTGNDATNALPASDPLRAQPTPPNVAPDGKPRPLSHDAAPSALRTASFSWPRQSFAPARQSGELNVIEQTLKKIDEEQAATLRALEAEVAERKARTTKAMAALGRVPGPSRAKQAPVGGPFVPYAAAPQDGFLQQALRVRLALAEHEHLHQQLERLPVLFPVEGDPEITSGYGPRVDPFLKRLALHAGVDLRGETGDPVRAAGAGTVIHAGRQNAYGLMVEIDHGNGLTTRYAHLSAILVKEGAKIGPGALIGKIGSTGRSTAPHLHYEVRLDGDSIDPRRYLRAARSLAGLD